MAILHDRHRLLYYAALSVTVLINILFWQKQGSWPCNSDYWEHVSIVNAFTKNIAHPPHHLFDASAQHPFFSPFHLGVAAYKIITNLHIELAFLTASIFNYTFFAIALYIATTSLYPEASNTLPSALLFSILFLFPPEMLTWSGFTHLGALQFTTPYPSLAMFALGLLGLSLTQYFTHLSIQKLVIKSVLLGIVLLVHPSTFIMFVVFDVSLLLSRENMTIDTFIKGSVFITTSLLLAIFLATLWPYYPILGLLKPMTNAFNTDSTVFKSTPLIIFTAVSLSYAFLSFKNSKGLKKALLTSIILASCIYFISLVFRQYGLMRIIAVNIICFQTLAAALISKTLTEKGTRTRFFGLSVLLSVALVICVKSGHFFIINSNNCDKDIYDSLSLLTSSSAVILTKRQDALYAAAKGVSVIASPHPTYWIQDNEDRIQFVDKFYQGTLEPDELESKLAQYNVTYIVVTQDMLSRGTFPILSNVILQNSQHAILELRK